jgi:hypothetical protein
MPAGSIVIVGSAAPHHEGPNVPNVAQA